jgi:hypothetical protein
LSPFQICIICFHKHTGFVRVVFCLFQSSVLPEGRGIPSFDTARPASDACLRQYVNNLTIFVGYHIRLGLSSENRAVVQFDVLAASWLGKWRRKLGGVRPTLPLTWV